MSSKFWNGNSPDDVNASWVDMPYYVEERSVDEQFYYMLGVRDEHTRKIKKLQTKPTRKTIWTRLLNQ